MRAKARSSCCRWANGLAGLGAALAASLAAGSPLQAAVTTGPPADKTAATSLVAPIAAEMRSAQARLQKNDTGPQTRAIQDAALRRLDELIKMAQRDSQNSDRSSGSGSPQGSPSDKQSSSAADQGSEAGTGPAAGQAGGPQKPGTGKPPAATTQAPPANRRLLAREVWGHLPPAVRERVKSEFSEQVLPAYDELVRRYFEALLEPAAPEPSQVFPASPK
jgi:hypothetical protein